MKTPDEFKIPDVEFPDEGKLIDQLSKADGIGGGSSEQTVSVSKFSKCIAQLATGIWKLKRRLTDPDTGNAKEDRGREFGDAERLERSLEDIGVETIDHTNQLFDYGLPWKVVGSQPMPGITREIVTHTIRPSVRWLGSAIQHAEVEIGTPLNSDKSNETDNN